MARTPTRRTPEQDARLADVVQATRQRAEAEQAYRAAVIAAYDAAATVTAIAEAAGITAPTMTRYIERHGPSTDEG